jgi:hypothetical protein
LIIFLTDNSNINSSFKSIMYDVCVISCIVFYIVIRQLINSNMVYDYQIDQEFPQAYKQVQHWEEQKIYPKADQDFIIIKSRVRRLPSMMTHFSRQDHY